MFFTTVPAVTAVAINSFFILSPPLVTTSSHFSDSTMQNGANKLAIAKPKLIGGKLTGVAPLQHKYPKHQVLLTF